MMTQARRKLFFLRRSSVISAFPGSPLQGEAVKLASKWWMSVPPQDNPELRAATPVCPHNTEVKVHRF